MGWYLKDLTQTCQDCGKEATYALHNPRNAPWGYFCKKCGKQRLKERQKKGDA